MYMHDIETNTDAFKYCIDGIVNNKEINCGKWADWVDADHVMEVYLSCPDQFTDLVLPNFKNLDFDFIRARIQFVLDYWQKRYQHVEDGSIATAEDWYNDYKSMDIETWFGLPAEECEELDWLDDNKHLVAV